MEHIRNKMNSDISDIPLFYGQPAKDTITVAVFINRIDQGMSNLTWTTAQAFVYFQNSLRGHALDWLSGILSDTPDLPKDWVAIKPSFRQQYGDKTDDYVFASNMGKLRLESFDNSLVSYYAAICKQLDLNMEKYLAATVAVAADLEMNGAQTLFARKCFKDGARAVHNDLKKQFFLAGLPTKLFDRVKNKRNLTTAREIMDHLQLAEEIERAKKMTIPDAAPALAPINDEEDDIYAINGYNRGVYNKPHGRGNQSGRGNGFARGRVSNGNQNNGYRGSNARGGNPGNSGNPNNANRGNGYNRGGNGNGNPARQQQQPATPFFKFKPNGAPICVFCKKAGHFQAVCMSRIAANKPCVGPDGSEYWPESQNASAQDSQQFDYQNSLYQSHWPEQQNSAQQHSAQQSVFQNRI